MDADAAQFELVCWGTATERDEPLVLKAEKAQLRVRIGNASAADSLNIPGLVIDQLETDSDHLPGELHGARPSAFGPLQGGGVRLVGHHVDPTEVARRLNRPLGSLPSHPQLGAAGVACYESLPVLERIAARSNGRPDSRSRCATSRQASLWRPTASNR